MPTAAARRRHSLALIGAALSLIGASDAAARARRVRYTFQPDCVRASLSAPCGPRKQGDRLDLGPQIAVWVESADGQRFIDTLMVTNLVAVRGLGNRTGHWSLPSGPKFPYGKRPMALPVWAHRRGRLYPTVTMQSGPQYETWLGSHETISSPDPYYCRPTRLEEIDVDAITCPTAVFNSAKGRFFDPKLDLAAEHVGAPGMPKFYVPPPTSYYPPRNDLQAFTARDCDVPATFSEGCPMSARGFAPMNDLDAVAAATPPYGRPFTRSWIVPEEIPDGDYALFVEVGKEFDRNASHAYTAWQDPNLRDSGLRTNLGQPSVVYRVPFRLASTGVTSAAVADIAGYGDWDGRTGTLHPADATISDTPGSGRGRLLPIEHSGRTGRVHVVGEVLDDLSPPDAGPPPSDAAADAVAPPGEDAAAEGDTGPGTADGAPLPPDASPSGCVAVAAAVSGLSAVAVAAERAELRFTEPTAPAWSRIDEYQVRVWTGGEATARAFESGVPAPGIAAGSPGGARTLTIPDLRARTAYTVGVRPGGYCLTPAIAYLSFTTPDRQFTKLSGCFVATAAYGSALAPQLGALRRARDAAARATPLAAAAAELYARSSPPLADALRGSGVSRAVVREALAPFAAIAAAVETLAAR